MRISTHAIKRLTLVPAVAAAVLLAGCGGVELEGPGFDALGISGKKKTVEQKVPDRAPLLIPPDRARLPQPEQSTASAPPQNWPTDPESIRKAEATEADKKKKEYEDKGDWSKKADIDEWEKLMDPMERQPGILSGSRGLSDANRDFKKYER